MNLRKIAALFSCAFLIGASPPIPEVTVGKPPFVERSQPKVQTSGGELLGFVGANLTLPASGARITVSGLSPTDKYICINIRHVSGTYLAAVTFSRPQNASSVVVVLPKNKVAAMRATRAELAILARASTGSTCSNTDPILPATWGGETPGPSAYLLINDHQSIRTRASIAGEAPQMCSQLSDILPRGKVLRSYHVACRLPVNGACGTAQSFAVKLMKGTTESSIRGRLRNVC